MQGSAARDIPREMQGHVFRQDIVEFSGLAPNHPGLCAKCLKPATIEERCTPPRLYCQECHMERLASRNTAAVPTAETLATAADGAACWECGRTVVRQGIVSWKRPRPRERVDRPGQREFCEQCSLKYGVFKRNQCHLCGDREKCRRIKKLNLYCCVTCLENLIYEKAKGPQE